MYAVLAFLRREARRYHQNALGFSGEYVYLCSLQDIPKGAIDSYASLSETDRCLEFIQASIQQGYNYL